MRHPDRVVEATTDDRRDVGPEVEQRDDDLDRLGVSERVIAQQVERRARHRRARMTADVDDVAVVELHFADAGPAVVQHGDA